MSIVTIPALKAYFETGDFPTQQQFIDLIDTLSNSGILFMQTITTAQVLQSFATPIDITDAPAPGAGKVIVPFSTFARIETYGGTPYATNTTLVLAHAGMVGSNGIVTNASLLSRTAACTKQLTPTAGASDDNPQYIANAGLQVKTLSGNPTAGNSNIIIYGSYTIRTL